MHRSAKRSALTPFLVFTFNKAIYVDIKNILYKKSLIRLITGTNLLNSLTTDDAERRTLHLTYIARKC